MIIKIFHLLSEEARQLLDNSSNASCFTVASDSFFLEI